ncbi:SH3 domain-containing YSC84-like protein 1 [Merluccius polli]|uniref:SH3 domain-containing YSC84-like protein 1 n=1 Tax=Merluccius polli TaxID=89951 RepID=A0AA47M5Q5_MERPO|nr:SH3 domain-containing YSC84-like protein 1 [Merluccius polli]
MPKACREFTSCGCTKGCLSQRCSCRSGHHLGHQGRFPDHGAGGSGIVIARLADRRWSAPSAIGIAGLGGGFEIGVEVSDLVIILLQRRAVDAFTKGGNLTLGGNCTVARSVRWNLSGGSCLIERKETNHKFYSQDIRASAILNGDVEPPAVCHDLYNILDTYTEAYTSEWTSKHMGTKVHTQTPTPRLTPPICRTSEAQSTQPPPEPRCPCIWGAGVPLVVTATHPFTGQQPGDLSMAPGITSPWYQDGLSVHWWEGRLADGRVGIFPANFVSWS